MGYVSALVHTKVLEKACANGDLTRAGVIAAFRQLTSVDTAGLTPMLNFSTAGVRPSRLSYLLKVDSSVVGGLTGSGYVAPVHLTTVANVGDATYWEPQNGYRFEYKKIWGK